MKKDFKKGQYVMATKDNKNIVTSHIRAIKKNKANDYMFLVSGVWYYEKELTHAKPKWFAPTDGQMRVIKKDYPIFKSAHIKVMFEHGKEVDGVFVGTFGFAYEKGDQKGNLVYRNGEFAPMLACISERYGF